MSLATLSTEIIDAILDALINGMWMDDRDVMLSRCSLVCKAWRGPSQRKLVATLAIMSGTRIRAVIEATRNPEIARGVHAVNLNCIGMDGCGTVSKPAKITTNDWISEDDVLTLLAQLPRLHSFCLMEPTFTKISPGRQLPAANFASLRKLGISTKCYDKMGDLPRIILPLTPNVVELYLGEEENTELTTKRKRKPRPPPAELPRLRSLKLSGDVYTNQFLQLGLISLKSLANLTHLTLSLYFKDIATQKIPPNELLQLVGPHLLSLTLGLTGYDDTSTILVPCTSLKHLTLSYISGPTILQHLPLSVQSIKFDREFHLVEALKLYRDRKPSTLDKLKRIEVGEYSDNALRPEVESLCREMGLELSWPPRPVDEADR